MMKKVVLILILFCVKCINAEQCSAKPYTEGSQVSIDVIVKNPRTFDKWVLIWKYEDYRGSLSRVALCHIYTDRTYKCNNKQGYQTSYNSDGDTASLVIKDLDRYRDHTMLSWYDDAVKIGECFLSVYCVPKIVNGSSPESGSFVKVFTPSNGEDLQVKITVDGYPEPSNYVLTKTENQNGTWTRRAVVDESLYDVKYENASYVTVPGRVPQGDVVLTLFRVNTTHSQYLLNIDNGIGKGLDFAFTVATIATTDSKNDDNSFLGDGIGLGIGLAVGVVLCVACFFGGMKVQNMRQTKREKGETEQSQQPDHNHNQQHQKPKQKPQQLEQHQQQQQQQKQPQRQHQQKLQDQEHRIQQQDDPSSINEDVMQPQNYSVLDVNDIQGFEMRQPEEYYLHINPSKESVENYSETNDTFIATPASTHLQNSTQRDQIYANEEDDGDHCYEDADPVYKNVDIN